MKNHIKLFRLYVAGFKVRLHGQGIGYCPFHDDKHRSFSFNVHTGLWICHAGCGSGNAYMFAKLMDVNRFKHVTY